MALGSLNFESHALLRVSAKTHSVNQEKGRRECFPKVEAPVVRKIFLWPYGETGSIPLNGSYANQVKYKLMYIFWS